MDRETTKKEDGLSQDLSSGGDDQSGKKAKASSSSSSTASSHPILPPPPLPRLHLYQLPDIAHEGIASSLTMKDMHGMMESSQWLLKTYGGHIKEVKLSCYESMPPAPTMVSIMRHRPGVTHVSTTNATTAFCQALADGLWPKMNKLVISNCALCGSQLTRALYSRTDEDKGCRLLKSLQVHETDERSRSPALSWEVLDEVEELKLPHLDDEAREDLSEWLVETKAPNLQVLDLPYTMDDVVGILCSPGVAPRLHTLRLSSRHWILPRLRKAIRRGAWPHLQVLDHEYIACDQYLPEQEPDVSDLVKALGVGAPKLTTLRLVHCGVGSDGGRALAQVLSNGGCPRLDELGVGWNWIGDDFVVELARALEGGAPCHTTLRRLDFRDCGVSGGMRELVKAMGRGALPHLESLNLAGNDIDDEGVVALAQAMIGGALQSLQELNLYDVGMTDEGAKPLFEAFRHHHACPLLKELDIDQNEEVGDGGVIELAKAIEAGALQHLHELSLCNVGMGEEGFKSLITAIVGQEQPNPGCPRLKVLYVGDNDIGDGGVTHLAEIMKVDGAMQRLRKIDIRAGYAGEEMKALLQTLRDS